MNELKMCHKCYGSGKVLRSMIYNDGCMELLDCPECNGQKAIENKPIIEDQAQKLEIPAKEIPEPKPVLSQKEIILNKRRAALEKARAARAANRNK